MSKSLKYPYNWGKPLVNKFVEKYARGTKNLARILDLSAYDVRHNLILVCCSGNSVKWESIKALIKTLDHEQWADYSRLTHQDRRLLYKYYRKITDDAALDTLIAREALDSARQFRLNL